MREDGDHLTQMFIHRSLLHWLSTGSLFIGVFAGAGGGATTNSKLGLRWFNGWKLKTGTLRCRSRPPSLATYSRIIIKAQRPGCPFEKHTVWSVKVEQKYRSFGQARVNNWEISGHRLYLFGELCGRIPEENASG